MVSRVPPRAAVIRCGADAGACVQRVVDRIEADRAKPGYAEKVPAAVQERDEVKRKEALVQLAALETAQQT